MKQHYFATGLLLASFVSSPALADEQQDGVQVDEAQEAVAAEDEPGDEDEPVRLGGLIASLLGEEGMSEEELQAAVEAASAYPLGSERNPVRADGPPGQRAYLSRLRCQNLDRPKFERRGSGGMSPFGGIVDIYEVQCKGSEPAEATVYMDMYHSEHFEEKAVPGFGITGGRRER